MDQQSNRLVKRVKGKIWFRIVHFLVAALSVFFIARSNGSHINDLVKDKSDTGSNRKPKPVPVDRREKPLSVGFFRYR